MNLFKLSKKTVIIGCGYLALSFFVVTGYGHSEKINFSVGHLRIEYLKNPEGVDLSHPRFTWALSGNHKDIEQTFYQILVATSQNNLHSGNAAAWTSRKIRSADTANVAYDGKKLKSDQTYFWKVKVWDQRGARSTSKVARFHTGLMQQSAWQGSWISASDTTVSAPLLRKGFLLKKPVRKATAFVTGVGFYRLYLNGKKVGDHVLDPGITNYQKRILYATYDVTNRLKKGANAVGIMLGNGPQRIYNTKNRYHWGAKQILGPLKAIMQLNIIFTDGTHTSIITNNSWTSHAGPITFNNIYGGEDYDARKVQKGWSSPNFNDAKWVKVKEVNSPGGEGELKAQMMPAIKVVQTIQPAKRTHPNQNLYLFDLKQNIPGWWRIQVQGKRGLKLRIRGAETLDDSLFPKPLKMKDRLSTKYKYHSQVYTDYTLNGDGKEVFKPAFFYTGFRYIEVRVNHPQELKSLKVEGQVVQTGLKRTGTFSSSDSLLNKIHHAAVWAQMGNTHSYPSDCPTREKGAYTGDGEVIAESSMHDFDIAAFYTNWIADMHDAQQNNGRIPNTAPTVLGGYGGGIAWGSAYILVPWWMHQYYGDTRILKKYYPSMKKYVNYLYHLARNDSRPNEKYIVNNFGGHWDSLGEWDAPGQSDGPNHPIVNTAYWYYDVVKFAEIARTLGKSADANHYHALANTIKDAFNKKFLNKKKYIYGNKPYQTYLILPLAFNLVPRVHRADVMHELINDIRQTHKKHLNTGILGAKYLFPVLMNSGHGKLLYKMVTQKTYPSWGYWINHGATTLWEKWSGKGSHNHQMFGSVEEFFYKYLAGIRAPTNEGASVGYRKIFIKPFIPHDLNHAGASIKTIRGTVKSTWAKSNDHLKLDVALPANTRGVVSIPTLGLHDITITEDGSKIWDQGKFVDSTLGVSDGTQQGQYVTFNVLSGNYEFNLSAGR